MSSFLDKRENKRKLIILGAESLGREAAEIGLYISGIESIEFLDDKPHLKEKSVNNIRVIGKFADWKHYNDENVIFFVAVGRSHIRKRIMETIMAEGGCLTSIIHPHSFIASSATVETGCLVNYGCYIGPNAKIGKGTVMWSGINVSHDTRIGKFCFISPGVTIGGYVSIGSYCMIGINTAICSDIFIGDRCAISMANIVTKDIPERVKVNRKGEAIAIEGDYPDDEFFRKHSNRAISWDKEIQV